MMASQYVYILKLAAYSWYVGVCQGDPEKAYTTHYNGLGGEWTSVHKPQSMEFVAVYADDESVTQLTLCLMKRYGIDKVRGYPWAESDLSTGSRMTVQSVVLRMSTNCWICGVPGHLPSLCQTPRCRVCHRHGHNASTCVSSRDRFGFPIDPNVVCSTCGHHSHSGKLICSWETNLIRDITDDLLSTHIVGVNAYRVGADFTEYCIETSGGNMWMRYSRLVDIYYELLFRDITVEGFPINTWYTWLMPHAKYTSDWRLACLNRYFKALPTRRVV